MVIKIGDACSMTAPESFKDTPDDRQEIVPTFNGNVVQDYGHVESGDKFSFSTQFSIEDFNTVYSYFHTRKLVSITYAGYTIDGCRAVIKSYAYVPWFETEAVKVELEIWRI